MKGRIKTYSLLFLVLCSIALALKYTLPKEKSLSQKELLDEIGKYGHARIPFDRVAFLDSVGAFINKQLMSVKGMTDFSLSDLENEQRQKSYRAFIDERFEQYKSTIKGDANDVMVELLESYHWLRKDSSDLPELDSKPLKVVAGKGEWASFQIAVSAIEKVDSVKLELGALSEFNPNVYQARYVDCGWSPISKSSMKVQDLLIPLMGRNTTYNSALGIAPYHSSSFFVRFFVDRSVLTQNSIKQLNIRMYRGGKSFVQQVPVELEVANFIYPKEKALNTIVGYNNDWYKFYYKDSLQSRHLQGQLSTLKQNGLFGIHLFPNNKEQHPSINNWAKWKSEGAKFFMLYYFDKDDYDAWEEDSLSRPKLIAYLKEKEALLEAQGLLAESYIFLFDELQADQDYKLYIIGKWLRKNGIKSKLITTSAFQPKANSVDVWCTLVQNVESSGIPSSWAYTCNTTDGEKYGNMFTDLSPVYARKTFMILYKKGINNWMYYAVNRWDKNLKYNYSSKSNTLLSGNNISWNAYSYQNFNGDGQLFYPGDDGQLLPSVRFFNFVDGMEDYELMHSKGIKTESLDGDIKSWLTLREQLLRGNVN